MKNDTIKFLAELEQAETLASSQNEVLVPSGERSCPICGEMMEIEEYPCGIMSHVNLDVCAKHGVWLDRGELPKIISNTKRVVSERRVSEVKKARLEGKKAGYIFGAWAFLFN